MTMVETRPNRRERKRQRAIEIAAAEAPSNALTSIVASAVNVRVVSGWQNVRWGGTEYQAEAWMHYDTCPEFHAGVNIGANNLSRARLIGVDVDPVTGEMGTQPSTDPDVAEILSQMFGGATGQSQALAQIYRHLDVAGDCWAFATDNPDVDGAGWEVLATTEVTRQGGGQIQVTRMDGTPRPVDTTSELLIRIWNAHPKNRWEADSSARSLLPVLRELAALTAMVSATVKSRLASAGILWIPDDIVLPAAKSASPNDTTQTKSLTAGAAGWLDLITEAMTAPIRDPDSASAVVPLVALAKLESIKEIRHMEFGKDLDAMIEPLREAGVKRLAVGMNLPPEVLLGIGQVNHWTAWAITEDYARAYLAPKLELIADAMTRFFLRPALRVLGRDPDAFAIGFDLDKLLPKQISIENAKHAWDARLLSERDYMEALGFSVAQLATKEERARRLIEELLARGNPQTLAEVASTIAVLYPGISIQPLTPAGGLGTAIGGTPAEQSQAVVEGAAAQGPPAIAAPPTTVPTGAAGT